MKTTRRSWQLFVFSVTTFALLVGSLLVVLQVHSNRIDPTSPGQVALAIFTDSYSGHYAGASKWLSPPLRRFYRHDIPTFSTDASSEADLAIGSISVSGKTAHVVITGTLCWHKTGRFPVTHKTWSSCFSNEDCLTARFEFTLKLDQSREGAWFEVPQTITYAPVN